MVGGVSGASAPQPMMSVSGPKPAPSAPPPPSGGGTLPGQAGAGIGDLQGVAQSSIARGQIVDIAA